MTFGAAVGTSKSLASLTSNAAGTIAINGGAVTTSGAQTYNDAAILGADTVFTANSGSLVHFASTLGGGGTARSVQIAVANAEFDAAVGGASNLLTSLSVAGTSLISGGSITTNAGQTYSGDASLGADTTISGVAVTFASKVNSQNSTARYLNIVDSGLTVFGGAVGTAYPLSTITTDTNGSTAIRGGSVVTTGLQNYKDPVVIGLTAANLSVSGVANGSDAVKFESTVDCASSTGLALAVAAGAGNVIFTGSVGTNYPPAALTVTSTGTAASAILADASILTSGSQTYNGYVTIVDSGSIGSIVESSGGLITFSSDVAHTSGTIQAGAVSAGSNALLFAGAYSAAGTDAKLLGSSSTNPYIEFDGDVTLGTLTQNGDIFYFGGSADQTFKSNSQSIGHVIIATTNAGAELTLGSDVNQTAESAPTIDIKAGAGLDLGSYGWLAASSGTAASGVFTGTTGSLTFEGSSTTLEAVDFTSASAYSIVNTGSNTVTLSGNAVIASSSFASPANSTIIMTGSSKTLSASPQIGSLSVSGSVTLGSALIMAGDMTISGSLDVSSSNYAIDFAGTTWTNTGTFAPEAGKVSLTKTSGTVSIYGNNSWYYLYCLIPGLTIRFEKAKTQTIIAGGELRIQGSESASCVLTRIDSDQTSSIPGWIIGAAPDAQYFWQLNLMPGATLANMLYVKVMYSDARAHPVAKPVSDSVVLFEAGSSAGDAYSKKTCYQWITGVLMLYAYTEDSDGNGRLDRIRVVAQSALAGDFSGFTATVAGYTVDTGKGSNGYKMVTSGGSYPDNTLPDSGSPSGYGGYGYEFFIYLVEKNYNDTGVKPVITIANTTLKDSSTGNYLLRMDEGIGNTCIDEAAPRVAYTLAVPDRNEVFFHFSEPVYGDSAGSTQISASNFSGASSVSIITYGSDGVGASEVLVAYASAATISSILAGENKTLVTVYDAAQTGIVNYATDGTWPAYFYNFFGALPPQPYNNTEYHLEGTTAWPTRIFSTTHRVSDMLLSAPPSSTAPSGYPPYFVWPVWAKDSRTVTLSQTEIEALTGTSAASTGIGLVRAFDGSQWLRDQDMTIQAKENSSIAGVGLTLVYDTSPASTYVSDYGLWLPGFSESEFSGIVPWPNDTDHSGSTVSVSNTQGSSTMLWNAAVDSSNSKIVSGKSFEFFYTVNGYGSSTAPLYCARLDMTAGGDIPANWYRLIKPFSFEIHDVRKQRGAVTILNNVIDPTQGETVRLSYQIESDGYVTVTVFTLDGDVVRRLYAGQQSAGDYSAAWDGKNGSGQSVARGMYFVRVLGPDVDEIRKVIVIRK